MTRRGAVWYGVKICLTLWAAAVAVLVIGGLR